PQVQRAVLAVPPEGHRVLAHWNIAAMEKPVVNGENLSLFGERLISALSRFIREERAVFE
ncbi:MAG: hypothetical protein RI564_08445, partial [Gracilimonas sp.]|nr:hypothetical protein [Gracilimonas sp.]